MAEKSKSIMDSVASMFSQSMVKPTPKPITKDVRQGAKADLAKTFKTNDDPNPMVRIKKGLGLE